MRQIVKSLINPIIKFKPIQFRYSTQTKNVFTLPKKQLIPGAALCHVSQAIQQAYTVRMLAYLFRDNIKYFIDLHVCSLFQQIYNHKLQIDDTLHSIIIPITIQYVNSFTIQNGTSLGGIAIAAAKLNIQHDKFWEAVLNKLDTQNIYRYLTLQQTVGLLHALVEQVTFINHPLINKLSNVVAMQKAYYQNFPQLLQLIKESNQIIQEKGPKILSISQAYQQLA